MSLQFFQTRMGQKLIERDVPRFVDAAERIATALERIAANLEETPHGSPEPAWGAGLPSMIADFLMDDAESIAYHTGADVEETVAFIHAIAGMGGREEGDE
jgi:vacuolar-type H+-ATPase catalytic subunit A/Vma1